VPNSDKSQVGSISGKTGDTVTVTCLQGYTGGGLVMCGVTGTFSLTGVDCALIELWILPISLTFPGRTVATFTAALQQQALSDAAADLGISVDKLSLQQPFTVSGANLVVQLQVDGFQTQEQTATAKANADNGISFGGGLGNGNVIVASSAAVRKPESQYGLLIWSIATFVKTNDFSATTWTETQTNLVRTSLAQQLNVSVSAIILSSIMAGTPLTVNFEVTNFASQKAALTALVQVASGLQLAAAPSLATSTTALTPNYSCGTPTLNAGFAVQVGSTVLNGQLGFVCLEFQGYMGTPSPVTCLATGKWDVIKGCTFQDCGVLPEVTRMTYSSGTSFFKSVRTASCSAGYQLTSSSPSTMTCEASGWTLPGACEPIPMTAAPTPKPWTVPPVTQVPEPTTPPEQGAATVSFSRAVRAGPPLVLSLLILLHVLCILSHA